jgi:hypothetical protein
MTSTPPQATPEQIQAAETAAGMFVKVATLHEKVQTLAERLRGIHFTPKHLRKERFERWKAEHDQAVEEHNKAADEFNIFVAAQKKPSVPLS